MPGSLKTSGSNPLRALITFERAYKTLYATLAASDRLRKKSEYIFGLKNKKQSNVCRINSWTSPSILSCFFLFFSFLPFRLRRSLLFDAEWIRFGRKFGLPFLFFCLLSPKDQGGPVRAPYPCSFTWQIEKRALLQSRK